jgi:signal transduction histidine kinase
MNTQTRSRQPVRDVIGIEQQPCRAIAATLGPARTGTRDWFPTMPGATVLRARPALAINAPSGMVTYLRRTAMLRKWAALLWRNAHLIRDRERALAQLEHLRSATELAANAERIELSRWLHDGLAQQLVAVGWSLDRIANRSLDEQGALAEIRKLRAAIDGALKIVHRKAVELRKPQSEHSELSVQIERYVTDFICRTDLSVDVLGTQYLERVPALRATLCLQIVQEALTNVAKHAKASRALVEIKQEIRAVHITITDDGCGIEAGARDRPDRLGLLGLHECLIAVGGSLDVSNVNPRGVRIEARVPIALGEPNS